MIREEYEVNPTTKFDIEIEAAPADGKKYPIVVVLHGNLGLEAPYGKQLRDFTQSICALGYLAALPSYYPRDFSDKTDTNVAQHVPALVAAIAHLANRKDGDKARLGFVGFSLGGGVAASYISANPAGAVQVFADFFGYVAPAISGGVANFPPTITFSNEEDPVVWPSVHTRPFINALNKQGIPCDPHWYKDNWPDGFLHAFEPGGQADKQSQQLTKDWLKKHMPPTGK